MKPSVSNKIAQKPLALQGKRSVTGGTLAPLWLLNGLPRQYVCRDGASVVAAIMLHQPEKSHGQNTIAQGDTSIYEDRQAHELDACRVTKNW